MGEVIIGGPCPMTPTQWAYPAEMATILVAVAGTLVMAATPACRPVPLPQAVTVESECNARLQLVPAAIAIVSFAFVPTLLRLPQAVTFPSALKARSRVSPAEICTAPFT